MQNTTETIRHKIVIINRAVSGSGKTSMTRYVIDDLRAHGLSVAVCSTDDFFMVDGRYVFELEKLNDYHAQNQANFIAELKRGTDVVICDNMNLLPWQSQPYTDAARKYNYRILFLNFLPRELEKHLASQIVTPEKPDAHGLSKETLVRFIRNFEDYNDLLDRNTVRDIQRHRVFTWNFVDNMAMNTGELAQYFDSDAVITICHKDFDIFKKTLAGSIMQIMNASDEELKHCDVKKRILLTWYGITDIRAALGFEPTDGPVLGALRTGRYTDVIILGYTNLNKQQDAFSNTVREEWEKLRAEPLETRLNYPRNKIQFFVDAACNTQAGHELFLDFLKAANLPVRIHFEPHPLSHLNDARGIDNAARSALNIALEGDEPKEISCFLSPGTPVMAYTWGMVSRTNPQLHLRVIASSDPRKPPEEIELPKDALSPSIVVNQTEPSTEFDVLIHLLGTDTNFPQYFSMVQFPVKKHWFITSAESQKANGLRRVLPKGATMNTITVDPFVSVHTRKAIENIVRSLPQTTRIGINLTGGTKLMFSGALSACNEFLNTEPFYFDIKQNNITFVRTESEIPFKGITSIDDLFTISGYDIATRGYWDDNPVREARKELTLKLWDKRKILRKLYKTAEFLAYKTDYGEPDPPFSFNVDGLVANYNGRNASIVLDGETIQPPECADFGSYLSGGWLEEYAYLHFLPRIESGEIFDLRIGMEVVPEGQRLKKGKMPVNEFDCVYTDGKRLYLVECKAGSVRQEHIQKLENNLKTYGGLAARGILFTTCSVYYTIRDRIERSTSIQLMDYR